MGLGRSSVIVVRPAGELSDLVVVLAVSPDLVHHGVRGVLREDDGLGHVVIVILSENQNESEFLLPKHAHIRAKKPFLEIFQWVFAKVQ